MKVGPTLLALMALLAAPAVAIEPFDPFAVATIVARPGARVPLDVPLVDAAGRSTTLRVVAGGRPLLLAPVLHDCPNLCGVTLAGLADAVAGQPLRAGLDFAVAAVSIDPAETPAAAARDLARITIRPSGRALGAAALVGSHTSIAAVTGALGYRYAWDRRINQYAHVAAVAVLTPDGRLVRWIYGLTPRPEAVADAIRAARVGTVGDSLADRLLLLCYHYDPVTGRYTPAIERLVRIAALLTVVALVLAVLRLRRRPA